MKPILKLMKVFVYRLMNMIKDEDFLQIVTVKVKMVKVVNQYVRKEKKDLIVEENKDAREINYLVITINA